MPPNLKFHLASAEEIRLLYEQHDFAKILSECRQVRVAIEQESMHEAMCCKKVATLFNDPGTDNEVAFIIEQTHKNPAKGTVRYIYRLRIADEIYGLKLP